MLLVGFFPNPCVLIGLGANLYVHPALPCQKDSKLIYNINEGYILPEIIIVVVLLEDIVAVDIVFNATTF